MKKKNKKNFENVQKFFQIFLQTFFKIQFLIPKIALQNSKNYFIWVKPSFHGLN